MVVTGVELIEIESISWSGSPKSQVVRVVGIEARNWGVVGHSDDFLAAFPVCSLGTTILVLVRVAVEPDLIRDVLPLDFPWVSTIEPEIWDFNLVSIFDGLLKDTKLVPNTVTPCWNFKCG